MRRALVFGGTTEGRRLTEALAALGAQVTVCVATGYGRQLQGVLPGVQVLAGRLDSAAMAALMARLAPALCVDATHPYAAEASRNIRAACAQAGVEYLRLLRPASALPAGCIQAASAAQAAALLQPTQGRILLTTGAKELPAFAGLEPARLYPRVLPTPASLAACAAARIPAANILALQGPFSQAFNEAILRQYGIRFLVTKDGGEAGGFAQKAAAAAACGVTLVVIRRPADAGQGYEAVLAACRARLGV